MCGIVGLIGSGVTTADAKVFRQLLQIDTLRGAHSTGMYVTDGTDKVLLKKAVDGYTFTDLKSFDKALAGTKLVPTFMLGHNRYATMGSITDENAHPFQCDDVTMVHNGSLKAGWKSYLEGASTTDVDSEAVCFNMAHEGFKTTIEKLRGAFSIFSHNSELNTVEFARNSERPMVFAHHKHRDVIYFASEAFMLHLVLTRNKITYNKPYSVTDDAIIKFDLSSADVIKSMEVDKDVKYQVVEDDFGWNYGNNYGGNYGGNYGKKSGQSGTSKRTSVHSPTLDSMGLGYNTEVAFYVSSSYAGYGDMRHLDGMIYSLETGRFISYGSITNVNGAVHDCQDGAILFCRPNYISGDTVQCISAYTPAQKKIDKFKEDCEDLLEVPEPPKGEVIALPKPEEDTKEEFMGNDYSMIDKAKFIEQVADGCAMCGSPIAHDKPQDSWGIIWLKEEFPVCETCVETNSDKGDSQLEIENKLLEALV